MGYQLLVTGAHLDYRAGARYGDVVQVTSRLERLTSRGLTFSYRVERDDRLLVRGSTEHVWVNVDTGRACRIPSALEAPFRSLLPGG